MSDAANLIPDDALLLCATPALARARREAHALAQKQAGHAVWQAPYVADWPSWLSRLWAQTWPDEQLLSSAQLLALWEDVVAADEAADSVVSRRALAREAMRTAAVVEQYQLNLDDAPRWTPEQAAFERWYTAVKQRMKAQRWLSQAQVPTALAAALARPVSKRGADNVMLPLPSAIVLDGTQIQPLLPSEQAAFDALRACGVTVSERHPPTAETVRRTGVALADPASQWRWLAQDIRSRFEGSVDGSGDTPGHLSGHRSGDADLPRISIACANPQEASEWLDAELAPVLAPWLADPAETARPVPWRVEPAPALSEHPLCAAALAVLRLQRFGNEFPRVSRVLLAGALWAGSNRQAAARLEAQLRKHAAPTVSLGDCVRLADTGLSERLQGFDNVLRDEPSSARPSAWARHFLKRLGALAWAGNAAQTSTTFQAARAVREAIDTLGSLDVQLGAVTRAEAVRWLGELCSRNFAPRAESVQSIQVLSFEDAALMPADHVYVVDAVDTALPQAAQRYSLLAAELQREIPSTSPQGQRARAVAIAKGLLSQACTPVFAATDARGAEADPCPLLIDRVDAQHPAPIMLSAGQLQPPERDPVPPVSDIERATLRGGTGILSAYLESPMIAVLKHRLGVAELEEAARGLTALQQGALMHRVLEEFWRQTQDSRGLAALGADALRERVQLIVDEVLPQYAPATRYPKQVIASEGVRARVLAERWLQHERKRVDAFRVVARERTAEFEFEQLPLRLTIDRVDVVQTDAGERVLILDYKTSKTVSPNGWRAQGDRSQFADPQLPLYATPEMQAAAGLDRVDGIGFAQVHRAQRWLAVVTNWAATIVDGDKAGLAQNRKTPDFDTLMADADAALREIVHGLLAGESGVDYTALGKGGYAGGAHPMLAVLPPPGGQDLIDMLAQDEGAA